MDWMNWKTWTTAALIIVALFAIYTFAAPEGSLGREAAPAPSIAETSPAVPVVRSPQPQAAGTPAPTTNVAGVERVHTEWLDAQSGSYRSARNLFSYREPPPPPPPAPPPPPPDKDKDGVPDFQDNCPTVANPNQADLDHNGAGDACQPNFVAPPPPPPPPPTPPAFDYKYIGTFGPAARPIATFTRNDEIVNIRVGEIIDGKFILRSIGIESAEIGFVGFPPDVRQRIPLAQ